MVAVLLYHAEVAAVPGGFLGVEVFFVLSGYLVTALLWREWRSRGGVALRRFWTARARRLLAANLLLIAAVAAALALGWPREAAGARAELVASLGYLSNWYLVLAEQSYFATLGRPSPVRHLWSLAVEAQFYLVWPVLLVALAAVLRGARRLAAATLVLAVGSAVLALALYQPGADPSRVYYGTDTRAAGLLLGGALALVWRPFDGGHGAAAPGGGSGGASARWRRRAVAVGIEAGTVVALAGLVVAFATVDELADSTYQGGLLAVSVLTALLVAVAVHPAGRLGPLLMGGAVVQAVGRRSYSLYLWHWPVFVFLRPGFDVPWSSGPTLVARLAVTVVLAELSYRFVEGPVRRGLLGRLARRVRATAQRGDRARRRQLALAWTGMSGVAVAAAGVLAALIVTADVPPPPFDAAPRVVVVEGPGAVLAAGAAPAEVAQNPFAGATPADDAGGVATGSPAGAASTSPPTAGPPWPSVPPDDGDLAPADPSVPASSGVAPAPPGATGALASLGAVPAAAPTTTTVRATAATDARTPPGETATSAAGAPAPSAAPPTAPPLPGPAAERAAQPSVYALGDSVMLSAADALEAELPGVGVDASVSRQVADGLGALAAWRAAGGTADVVVVHLGNNGQFHGGQVDEVMALVAPTTRVVFVNVRVPRRWEEQVNWSLGEVVPRHANAILVDWHAASQHCPPGSFAEDGVHLQGAGRACYARLVGAAVR